jgi:6-methylsalicylic acid synthase
MHGVARILAGEHPELWGGLVDSADEPDGARLLHLLRNGLGEDLITTTREGDFVARLTQVERPLRQPPSLYRPDSTDLLTGGLGALGIEVARWMAGRGARRLILAGRGGLPPRGDWHTISDPTVRQRIEAVKALEIMGVTVRILALDIADFDKTAAALDPTSLDLPPIRGIVHAAGVVADARIPDVRRQSLADVMRPKACGAMVLHRLFPPGTLDFFALFSSCGQFARITGQAA